MIIWQPITIFRILTHNELLFSHTVLTYWSGHHIIHQGPQAPPVYCSVVTRPGQDLWSPGREEDIHIMHMWIVWGCVLTGYNVGNVFNMSNDSENTENSKFNIRLHLFATCTDIQCMKYANVTQNVITHCTLMFQVYKLCLNILYLNILHQHEHNIFSFQ